MNYKVYQGAELKQTVTSKMAVMNGLQPNTTYEFSVTPNNGFRDGDQKTITVPTRGIRFNIPKTLTIGSTITLRYEEYPLGIIPIGTEPSGMFGGGNKQNLSAKVISTSNGSSVVEVAGNVIDIGNKNLWITSKVASGWLDRDSGKPNPTSVPDAMIPDPITIPAGAKSLIMTTYNPNKVVNTGSSYRAAFFNGSTYLGNIKDCYLTGETVQTIKWDIPSEATKVYLSSVLAPNGVSIHDPSIYIKYEFGNVATPYASFVDGDTFTAQPDGTYALISEYKALYY